MLSVLIGGDLVAMFFADAKANSIWLHIAIETLFIAILGVVLYRIFFKTKIRLKELDRIQEELNENEQLLKSLLDLSQRSLELSQEEVFSAAADLVEDFTESHGAFIHQVDGDNEIVELKGWSKRTIEICSIPNERHYPIAKAGIWADAFRSKSPVIINDYPGLISENKKGTPKGHFVLHRLVSVPVMESGEVRLMLGVANKKSDYTDEDANKLMLIGGFAWKIIETKNEQLQRKALEIEFKNTFEQTSIGMAHGDVHGSILRVNQRFCEMVGYGSEELIGASFRKVAINEDITEELRFAANLAEGKINDFCLLKQLVRKNEETFWVKWNISASRNASGELQYLIGAVEDIDELITTQNELLNKQNLLRLSQKVARLAYWRLNALTLQIEWSEDAPGIYRTDKATLGNRFEDVLELSHPEDIEALRSIYQKSLKGIKPFQITHRTKPIDQSCAYLQVRGEPEYDQLGKFRGYIGTVQDISEQIQNQQFVVETQAQFKKVFNSVADAVYIADTNGNILEVNDEGCRDLLMTREDILRLNVLDLDPTVKLVGGIKVLQDQWKESHEEKKVIIYQGMHRRSDSSIFPVEMRIRATYFRGQPAIIGAARDLTLLNKNAELLRIQNQALETAENAIFITDTNGKILWVNKSFNKITGYDSTEVLGLFPSFLKSGEHSKETYTDLWTTILQGKVWHGELKNKRKDESTYKARVTIAPVRDEQGQISHFVSIQQDITQMEELEQQFRRSQRMETIGLLAGGIAHDLNNVLAPIMMSLPLLKEELISESTAELITTIESCLDRGTDIIRQVLTFSRGMQGERITLQTRHLLKELMSMIRETFPKDVQVRLYANSDLWPVEGDPTQLQQVFLNLAVNARDAMPNGGSLKIHCSNIVLNEPLSYLNMRIKPGRYSCIAFEDTGSGIDAETLDKIFEPFFTTKAHGKGTGLGLPTALGIIRSHKGLIRVDSKPGKGTEFQVYLPASNVEAPGPVSQEAASKFEGTRELVLIVDDEETIRKTIRFALSKSDCRTLEAKNGQEALEVLKAYSGDISLVITDRMMPFMNGETLARNIRKDFPNVKIIGMSGAMEDPKNDQNVKEAEGEPLFDAYLFKPFSRELLLQTIHKTLSQSAEPS